MQSIVRFSQFTLRSVCSSLILLAAFLIPAFGGFRPSFSLDYCSWNATHIFLAEVSPHDDDFQVIESWKGNLKPGEHIRVPQLQPGPRAIAIALYSKQHRPYHPSSNASGNTYIDDVPRQPVGSRIVLFLRQDRQPAPAPGDSPITEKSEWQPADLFNEIRSSVIWLDGTKLYVFTQWMNPGPSLISNWNNSLPSVRARVKEVIGIQEALGDASRTKDKSERAERLRPYVQSDVFSAKQFALEQLGKCGPSALGIIRTMLDDPAYAPQADDLIKAYSEAGGESAGPELDNRLQNEFSFWQATGPTLQHGWWNLDATPSAPLRLRYGQTIQLIRALQHTHYAPALTTATHLRDLWKSLPQLNDPSGLDGLTRECDSLIKHLTPRE